MRICITRVIPALRSKITRGCIPDREGRKKTRIYSAVSSPFITFFFPPRSVPGVFPYLIYSFFSTPNSFTFLFLSLFLSLLLSLFSLIHWFCSASFCEICDPMLHADSMVASRRPTFISLPLRKLSWRASPGASERNVTFWKPLSGVVCRKLCVIWNAHAAFGRISPKLIDMPSFFFLIPWEAV